MLFKRLFGARRLHFVQMLFQIFNRMKALNQRGRRLFADRGDARDVVGGIAHQRLDINEFLRRDPVGLPDRLRREIENLGLAAAGLRQTNQNVAIRELQKIPVTGHNRDLISLFLAAFCEGSDHIVRLIALQRHCLNLHGAKELF